MFVPSNIYREWAKYKPLASASVVILNQDNQVLLLQRASGVNKGLWEISGGGIEKSETPKEAALRELQEETGIKLDTPTKEIGTFKADNPDKVDIITVFLAHVINPISIKLNHEFNAFEWVDLQRAIELPMHPTNAEILQTVDNCPSVTILAPCLNEITGLQKILPKIKKEWYDQLIILDGWSTDGSRDWCKSNGYTVLLRSKPNVGLWDAYTEAFNSGLIKGDIIITFSPDGNSIPEAIPLLIDAIKFSDYDMVIASRYACGAKSYDDTKITGIGNRLFTTLINILCRGRYTDALVMFRAYKKGIVEQLGFTSGVPKVHKWAQKVSGLSSWEPPMAIRAVKAGLKIAEIPASEPEAYRERRQVTLVHGFVILAQILYEGLIRKGGQK